MLSAAEITSLLNTPPTLAAIADRVITAGTVLTITNSATDPGVPPQTLTYSLTGTPSAGATIASNGVFNWRPTIAQAGTTNLFNVQVADNSLRLLPIQRSCGNQLLSALLSRAPWPVSKIRESREGGSSLRYLKADRRRISADGLDLSFITSVSDNKG